MVVRPFPYASLPKLTRRQLQLSTALRANWGNTQTEQALAAVRGLLGRELTVSLGVAEACSAQELELRCAGNAAICVLIEQTQLARPVTCALELSPHVAQQLVDLALGGDASQLTTPSLAQLDELSRGALAYVIARALAALSRFQLRGISELSQLAAALPQLLGDSVVCPIALQLGTLQLNLRLYIPEVASWQRPPQREPVRNLEQLPVELVARAGSVTLPLSEIHALTRGDVIVLEHSALAREGGQWRGQVDASLFGSRSQLQCGIEEQGLRVVRRADAKEQPMSTGHVDKQTAADSNIASDAPIELQVEIARFSLSLGELQRLQEGDVLSTGRRIGERVSVRVGGQTFAEGELVDIEGEVGVRLLSFTK